MTATLSPHAAGTSGQSSALSETVDMRRGHIRASGHLTRQGADLLRGTADTLRISGHSHVVLDLRDVRGADAAGLAGRVGWDRDGEIGVGHGVAALAREQHAAVGRGLAGRGHEHVDPRRARQLFGLGDGQ